MKHGKEAEELGKMRFVTILLIVVFAVACPLTALAGTMTDYLESKKIYIAAAACMAAYNSRPGSLAVAAFEQEGWRIEPFKQVSEKVDVKYMLAWNTTSTSEQDTYLLAVAGTESVRDAKLDLRTKKVYFAGKTLPEFADNAARKDVSPDAPRVHEGFNQATQLLLEAESAQSNDTQAGTMRRVANILKEDKQDKVILVGHSLGGAVVTLAAARLLDMGVRPDQIEVVTFGAPAVGNEAFAAQYDGRVPVTRYVMDADPVPSALRRVFGGYRHIGREVVWRTPETLKSYFGHDVPVYVDMALRNYYPKRRAAINEGIISLPEPIPDKPRLYIAPIKNSLPPALKSDFPFMQEALWNEYELVSAGNVVDRAEAVAATYFDKAAKAGCTLLVVPEIQAVRVREANTYYVSLNQAVFRVSDGTTVNAGMFGSNTKELTPLDALIHGAKAMNKESAAWLERNLHAGQRSE